MSYQKPGSGLGKVRVIAQARQERDVETVKTLTRASALRTLANAPKRDANGRLRDRRGHFVKSARG